MATANTQMFVSKHPFQGNPAQSQLTFPAGAAIAVRPGQEGKAWWWGSYQGKEGWFPPAYVAPAAAATLPQRRSRPCSSGCSRRPSPRALRPRFRSRGSSCRSLSLGPRLRCSSSSSAAPAGVNMFSPTASASAPTSFGQPAQQQQQQRVGQGFGAMSAAGIDPFAGLESSPPPMSAGGAGRAPGSAAAAAGQSMMSPTANGMPNQPTKTANPLTASSPPGVTTAFSGMRVSSPTPSSSSTPAAAGASLKTNPFQSKTMQQQGMQARTQPKQQQQQRTPVQAQQQQQQQQSRSSNLDRLQARHRPVATTEPLRLRVAIPMHPLRRRRQQEVHRQLS